MEQNNLSEEINTHINKIIEKEMCVSYLNKGSFLNILHCNIGKLIDEYDQLY